MAGAKYLLKTPSKLQSSGMSEVSESTDTEGLSTDSTLGTTVTTCKKVLCNNNLPESTEYWLHNEKVLSRICFIEDNTDNGCTTVCFANMERHKGNERDASWLKKLAFVSPVLPKLMDSLSMHQLKENEILIHSGLESPRSCPSDSTFEHISSQNQCAGVCLVQYGGKQQPTSPCSMVFEVNKFLIGLELCQEQQTCNLLVGHRVEDDTNRSLSSVEDDFLTASEYFDSEEDALRNDAESTDVAVKEKGSRLRHHKRHISKQERSNDSEVTIQASFKMLPASFSSGAQQRPSCTAQSERTSCKVQSERTFCKAQSESTGHYAINLAESVLQDAFICLSQDEATNATHADSSMSEGTHPVPEEFPQPPTYTFELPKIVIVQSPDNQEEVSEWSETSPLPILSEQMSASAPSENMPPACGFFSSGHPPRSVELALACAANVIGTISSPQVTEQLSLQPGLGDMGVEQKHGVEYSFSSALCGMVQVAGAIAIVDLAEDAGELGKKVDPGICCPSIGLISTTEASSAVTFQHSVAEGTSIKASCANIAEILLKEAFAVLSQPEDQSVRDFLESTHDKIVNGISHPKLSCSDEREVQEFAHVIAEGIFKHAWEKTIEKKKIKGSDTTLFPTSFLYEYVNNLLFDVLCITSKKITDVLTTNNGSGDRQDEEVKKFDNADMRKSKELLSQKHHLAQTIQPDTSEKQNNLVQGTNIRSGVTECKYMKKKEEEQICGSVNSSSVQAKDQTIADQMNDISLSVTESSLLQSEFGQQNSTKESKKIFSLEVKQSSSDVSINNGITMNTEIHKARVLRDGEHKSFSLITQLTPQHSLSFGGSAVVTKKDAETRSTMSCFADDLATTVVSMATELAAICLENSSGKQPWFCSLQTRAREGPESYLLPCRTARRKEAQCGAVVTKKHRPPRLSEIKRKTEEQPELMERLVNRVVDESGISDEPADPFAKFASEVTAKIMNCPELGLIDTSKPGQPRNRLQCTAMERWSRGKASSYESIPEEDTDTYNLAHTLGLGSRLGQNLSRGSSISKQSSCESITDEFSRFMVNQMENEGRGFDLLLDYYAGKNASSILNAAMQQVVTKKNGHLNVRSTCLSKQSSTESITEEFYRFMLKDIDKENKDYSLSKTREWNNSLLPPSHRTPLCFRQSSMPDRRSSDSRLTVNSPVKANSFDGFARYSHGDSLNIFPANTVSAMALCKSDSCLYQKGKTDQITDMLIHETWSNSIESLMRKNKIIVNSEDSVDLEVPADLQPQVELFANRLAADIVESGKSVLGSQSENLLGQQSRPVGERRRGFKQSRPCWSNNNYQDQQASTKGNDDINASSLPQQPRKVPLIHIEADLKENLSEDTKNIRELPQKNSPLKCKGFVKHSSSENERAGVSAGCEQEQLPLSASSEESTGSWSHIATDDDPHEETSSYIQLSDGNGNSSASSLGIADLEAFSDIPLPSTLVSATAEKESIKSSQDNVDEGTSGHSVGGSSSHREMLVMNFDLEPDSMDSEMQAALQWIAASELGITTIYFKKSQVKRREKFLEVVQLVTQKSWRVGDLFHAMVQFCKLQEENRDSVSSLFDWLLATK